MRCHQYHRQKTGSGRMCGYVNQVIKGLDKPGLQTIKISHYEAYLITLKDIRHLSEV